MASILDTLNNHPLTARLLGAAEALPLGRKLLQYFRENEREVVRFLKFSLVGTLGAVIDFGVLNLLILGVGLPKFWANTCSFTTAVLSNFTWNRLWTFPESRERSLKTQLPQFALVNVAGLAINQFVFLSLDHFLFGPLLGRLGYNLAKAVATLIVLFWNYGINRIWTYKGL
ncbi:MAG: GtrA family protein [Anaerolineae bacterium]